MQLTERQAKLSRLCLSIVHPLPVILPSALSFAAGAIIYVVVEELIPESQHEKHTDVSNIGAMRL